MSQSRIETKTAQVEGHTCVKGNVPDIKYHRLSGVAVLVLAAFLFLETANAAALDAIQSPSPGDTCSVLVAELQTYEFKITTDSKETQAWFNQGLQLMYGFNHGEAIRSFREAAVRDPEAAMPWWGIAYANGMHLNFPEVTESQWKAGRQAADRAIAALDEETELERALVHAIAVRTAWPVPEDQRPYDEAFASRMEDVYNRFPGNADVCIQYAESLMNLQPWDYWTETLEPKGRTDEFVAVIEQALKNNPKHPQAAHLYIHALEAGSNPGKAEFAADMLNDRVSGAGHLVHMPSHLYLRVGRYADAVIANEKAVAADDRYFEIGTDPGTYYAYHAHNLHVLAFGCMMEARYEPALAAAQRLETGVPEPVLDEFAFLIEGIIPTTYHVMIRFGKWEDILRKKTPPEKRPMKRAIHYYARGIAYSSLNRTEEAHQEEARFENQIKKVPPDWWVFSNKAHDVLPIGRLMLKGELAYREGRLDDAWASLEEAIEAEDQLLYDEPPGWMIPVRHAMGALLMETGQYERAEKLYREDQVNHPKNGWSLLGLKQSLLAQGRKEDAEKITAKLDQAWKRVETRPSSSCMCAPDNDKLVKNK